MNEGLKDPMLDAILDDESSNMDTPTPELTNADRCDVCGAQAYVRIVNIETDRDLLFCHHHFVGVEKSEKFSEDEWIIWDESHKLNQKLDASA